MPGLVRRRSALLALLAFTFAPASAGAFWTDVPLPSEIALRIVQGPGGAASHADVHNRYAVDLLAPAGTPVLAGFDGVVVSVQSGCAPLVASDCGFGWGNNVLLAHADGTCAMHAHLATVAVVPGLRVTRRALLGTIGASGAATGPHLHYDRMACDTRLSLPWAFGTESPPPPPPPQPQLAAAVPAARPSVAPFTPTFLLAEGSVTAVQRIAGLEPGAIVTLRCVSGCARPLRVVARAGARPSRLRIAIRGGLRLRAATRLELRVSRPRATARATRYRFTHGGTAVVAVSTP